MLKRRTSSMHQGEEIALERLRDYIQTKYGKEGVESFASETFQLDDATFIRFLRAREFDLERSVFMLESHLAFRAAWKPDCISSLEPKIIHGLTLHGGFWRIAGRSLAGSVVQTYDLGKYDANVYLHANTIQDFTRLLLYQNECVKRTYLADKRVCGEPKTLLVFDYTHFSFAKHATPTAIKIISVLADVMQNHYPEFLELGIIYNAPRAFPLFWRLVRPFLQEKLKHKVLFVNQGDLDKYIPKEDLLVKYGGMREEEYPITLFQ